jgi:hypothetical protein
MTIAGLPKVSAQDVISSLASTKVEFGVKAVAFGAKQVGGVFDFDRPALTFFVPKKLPLGASKTKLIDGTSALPSAVPMDGLQIETDVIEISSAPETATGVITGAAAYVPGGKLAGDNGDGMGTMACMVRNRQSGRPMALTNRHIAPTVNGFAYFYRNTNWFLARPVIAAVENETFARFVHFSGPPGQVISVDASLVDLAPELLQHFDNAVPHLGKLGAPFPSNLTDVSAYFESVKGRQVASYGWKTKRRTGVVTHAFSALEASNGAITVGCLLITGTNGVPPSEPGDSGKLWVTDGSMPNMPIGLNMGTTFDTMVAVATDFRALSDYWNFDVL